MKKIVFSLLGLFVMAIVITKVILFVSEDDTIVNDSNIKKSHTTKNHSLSVSNEEVNFTIEDMQILLNSIINHESNFSMLSRKNSNEKHSELIMLSTPNDESNFSILDINELNRSDNFMNKP